MQKVTLIEPKQPLYRSLKVLLGGLGSCQEEAAWDERLEKLLPDGTIHNEILAKNRIGIVCWFRETDDVSGDFV